MTDASHQEGLTLGRMQTHQEGLSSGQNERKKQADFVGRQA